MKILYGTTNQAKLTSMQRLTASLPIEIIGLKDLNRPLPQVDESGRDLLENAKIKAKAYYEAFGMPVFSCDSGLYFEGLEEERQPGPHTRRVRGKELTDEEMIEYYGQLAREHGGRLIGRYRNAVCFILDENTSFLSMDEALATEWVAITGVPHPRRVKGYPLDSLSVDIETGEYFYDMKERSVDQTAIEQGFRDFWENVLVKIGEIEQKRMRCG